VSGAVCPKCGAAPGKSSTVFQRGATQHTCLPCNHVWTEPIPGALPPAPTVEERLANIEVALSGLLVVLTPIVRHLGHKPLEEVWSKAVAEFEAGRPK